MAKLTGVKIIGLDGLRARIEQAVRQHERQIEKTLSEIGDVGVYESALRAPVDEGMLTESIEKHLGEDEDGHAVAGKSTTFRISDLKNRDFSGILPYFSLTLYNYHRKDAGTPCPNGKTSTKS